MRAAAIHRAWEKAASEASDVLLSFSYSELSGLGDGQLRPSRRIACLGGLNGSGKSSLLSAIHACIRGEDALPKHLRRRWQRGTLEGKIKWRGDEYDLKYEIARAEPMVNGGRQPESFTDKFEIAFVDPSTEVPWLQQTLRSDPNIEDFLTQAQPEELKAAELRDISHLVGKNYDRVLMYEIDIAAEPLPYFSVRAGDHTYGSEDMGLGELSAMYVYWALRRLGKGALLLLDEPESFLSRQSQVAVIDHLAVVCSKKRIGAVVTTHSPDVVARMSLEMMNVLVSTHSGVSLVRASDAKAHLERLGHKRGVEVLFLLEDVGAVTVARWIVRTKLRDLAPLSEFLGCGGESKALDLQKLFPAKHSRMRIVTILDGDMRDKDVAGDVLFLPGSEAPEPQLRRTAEMRSGELAARLGLDGATVEMALDRVRGVDHHDWASELARDLGYTTSDILVDGILSLWAEDRCISEQLDALAKEVKQRFDSPDLLVAQQLAPPDKPEFGDVERRVATSLDEAEGEGVKTKTSRSTGLGVISSQVRRIFTRFLA